MKSSYTVDGQSRRYPCYLVTKKGCEFIAHKLTGTKGTLFTATYINRFHEMEDVLNDGMVSALEQTIKEQSELIKSYAAFMDEQREFNQKVLDFMSASSQKTSVGRCGYADSLEDDCVQGRVECLNSLVRQVTEMYSLTSNVVLYQMYLKIEEALDVSLREYAEIVDGVSTFRLICMVDRFYDEAVKLNEMAILVKRAKAA